MCGCKCCMSPRVDHRVSCVIPAVAVAIAPADVSVALQLHGFYSSTVVSYV